MIVTVHLLCGRGCRMGGVFYIMIIQLHSRLPWVWGMLPQENFEKIVSFGAFLFIFGSDFVLNNF